MNTPPLISVLTPVYNRASKIHRVFESLEKSTYRHFELIIMDDGSTDNIVEVVEKYKNKVTYPITFIQKKNEGKHVALNILHQLAQGEYIFQLDSDDEIMPDTMQKALDTWASIPLEERDQYWCVVGRIIDQHQGKIQGELFPEGINNHSWEVSKSIAQKIPEDKSSLQRSEILKQYRLPEPKGVKFVTECILWNLIQQDYKEYFTNDIQKLCYLNEGESLSNPSKNIQWAKNTYFNRIYMLNRGDIYKVSFTQYWRYIIHFSICYLLLDRTDRSELEKPSFKNKFASMFILPPIYILLPFIKKKIRWK